MRRPGRCVDTVLRRGSLSLNSRELTDLHSQCMLPTCDQLTSTTVVPLLDDRQSSAARRRGAECCGRRHTNNKLGNDAKHKGLGFGGCAGRAGRAASCSPVFGLRDRGRSHSPPPLFERVSSGAASSRDPAPGSEHFLVRLQVVSTPSLCDADLSVPSVACKRSVEAASSAEHA